MIKYCFMITLFIYQVKGQCSSTLNVYSSLESAGTLTSPNYPSSYPRNAHCSWQIDSGGSDRHVVIVIQVMNIEVRYDKLQLFEGSTRLAQLDGTGSNLLYESTGQYMTIEFDSDFSVERIGFSLQYFSVYNTGSANLNKVPCSPISGGLTFSASSSATQQQALESFPALYSGSDACYWTLDAGTGNALNISVIFTDIVNTQRCQPGLYIYDGSSSTNLLRTICDSSETVNNPVTITTSGQYAYLNFQKGTSQYRGFVLAYSITVISFGTVQSPTVTYDQGSSQCGNVQLYAYRSRSSYITSENFPSDYLRNSDCTWIVSTNEPYTTIQISIDTIDTEACCDGLSIYDGGSTSYTRLAYLRGQYSSTNLPTYNSTGSTVLFHFTSDGLIQNTGFKLLFTAVDQNFPICTRSLSVRTDLYPAYIIQTFYSHAGFINGYDYSDNYENYWLMIKPNESTLITFKFVHFALENQLNCDYDSLKVYNGPCTSYELLYTFCGSSHEGSDYSSKYGKYLLFYFKTDGSITDTGFEIFYRLGNSTSSDDDDEESGSLLPLYIFIGFVVFGLICLACVCCMNKQKKRQVKPSEPKKNEFVLKKSPGYQRHSKPHGLKPIQKVYPIIGPNSNGQNNLQITNTKPDTVVDISAAPQNHSLGQKKKKKKTRSHTTSDIQPILEADELNENSKHETETHVKSDQSQVTSFIQNGDVKNPSLKVAEGKPELDTVIILSENNTNPPVKEKTKKRKKNATKRSKRKRVTPPGTVDQMTNDQRRKSSAGDSDEKPQLNSPSDTAPVDNAGNQEAKRPKSATGDNEQTRNAGLMTSGGNIKKSSLNEKSEKYGIELTDLTCDAEEVPPPFNYIPPHS